MKKIRGRQDNILKDSEVSTELGSSIRSMRRGKSEVKRIFKVRALKAVRNRVLTEKMFFFFKAPAW